MAIIARGSENIWESFQVARDGHITKNGGKFNVEVVRGVLRSGVLRSEFRTKILGKRVFQIRMAYDFTIETDQRGDGEAVITQVWDGGSPTNSIRWDYATNRLYYRLYKDSSGPRQDFDLGPLVKGQKVRIAIVLNAMSNNNGTTEIYFNGKKVVDFKGRNLYGNVDSDPYVKFGLYDDDDLPSGMPNRKVTFDNIIIGDSSTTLEELVINGGVVIPEEPEEEEPEVPNEPPVETDPVKPDLSAIDQFINSIENSLNQLKQAVNKLR